MNFDFSLLRTRLSASHNGRGPWKILGNGVDFSPRYHTGRSVVATSPLLQARAFFSPSRRGGEARDATSNRRDQRGKMKGSNNFSLISQSRGVSSPIRTSYHHHLHPFPPPPGTSHQPLSSLREETQSRAMSAAIALVGSRIFGGREGGAGGGSGGRRSRDQHKQRSTTKTGCVHGGGRSVGEKTHFRARFKGKKCGDDLVEKAQERKCYYTSYPYSNPTPFDHRGVSNTPQRSRPGCIQQERTLGHTRVLWGYKQGFITAPPVPSQMII